MRADTKKKHNIGKRFAILIGVAAVGVIALGAQTVIPQTAAAASDVVSYDTRLGITHERPWHGRTLWHGGLRSNSHQGCGVGREVILFRKRPGPDRKLGADRTTLADRLWAWSIKASDRGRVYAKAMPKVGDGFVCRADRSRTIDNPWGAGLTTPRDTQQPAMKINTTRQSLSSTPSAG
jgi:hypothetical protein